MSSTKTTEASSLSLGAHARSPRLTAVVAGAAALLVLCLGATAARAQEETPAAVERAAQTIRAEAKEILSWAYPTVTYRGLGDCAWHSLDSGYDLVCSWVYVDMFGDREVRRLGFVLNGRGAITTIEDRGGGSIVAPFATIRFAKELLKEKAKSDLERGVGHDRTTDRAMLELLASSPEPETVLAFLLNAEMVLGR